VCAAGHTVPLQLLLLLPQVQCSRHVYVFIMCCISLAGSWATARPGLMIGTSSGWVGCCRYGCIIRLLVLLLPLLLLHCSSSSRCCSSGCCNTYYCCCCCWCSQRLKHTHSLLSPVMSLHANGNVPTKRATAAAAALPDCTTTLNTCHCNHTHSVLSSVLPLHAAGMVPDSPLASGSWKV
jgi:hypothetical protein